MRIVKPQITTRLAVVCLAASICMAQNDPRWITGTYQNPSLGYSVNLPPGLKGLTGDQAGPERGLRISLSSGGVISIFGEPNSLEWKTPQQGVRWLLRSAKCASNPRQAQSTALVGELAGAKGVLVCRDRVLEVLLAFRPGGAPIYWLQLETTSEHQREDEAVLNNVAATFNLIPWG